MASRGFRLLAGVSLLALALAGTVRGARAAAASVLYHRAKYGAAREDLAVSLRLCDQAHRLYPANYFLCIWAAESAYYAAIRETGPAADDRLRIAERWCDEGLRLNFYKSQLRLLKARLLRRTSVEGSRRFWEAYVDWHFWDPYHHAVLAEWHAAAGDYDKALQSLAWTRGSPHYDTARRRIAELWAAEANP